MTLSKDQWGQVIITVKFYSSTATLRIADDNTDENGGNTGDFGIYDKTGYPRWFPVTLNQNDVVQDINNGYGEITLYGYSDNNKTIYITLEDQQQQKDTKSIYVKGVT